MYIKFSTILLRILKLFGLQRLFLTSSNWSNFKKSELLMLYVICLLLYVMLCYVMLCYMLCYMFIVILLYAICLYVYMLYKTYEGNHASRKTSHEKHTHGNTVISTCHKELEHHFLFKVIF